MVKRYCIYVKICLIVPFKYLWSSICWLYFNKEKMRETLGEKRKVPFVHFIIVFVSCTVYTLVNYTFSHGPDCTSNLIPLHLFVSSFILLDRCALSTLQAQILSIWDRKTSWTQYFSPVSPWPFGGDWARQVQQFTLAFMTLCGLASAYDDRRSTGYGSQWDRCRTK